MAYRVSLSDMFAVGGGVVGVLWAAVANVGGEFGGLKGVCRQDSTRWTDSPDGHALRWCRRRAGYGAPVDWAEGVKEAWEEWRGPQGSLQTDVVRIHFVVSVLGLALIGGGCGCLARRALACRLP